MKAFAGLLTIVLLFVNLSVQTLFAGSLEKTFSAEPALELKADGASIELTGGNTGKIEFAVESNLDLEEYYELSSEVDNGVLKITFELKDRDFSIFKMFRNNSTHIRLNVPRQTACTLNTSGGSIETSSLDADLDAHTSGGRIECTDVRGEVTLKTSGGGISLKRVSGDFDARTSGGSIQAEEVKGDGELHTSGGRITLESCRGAIVLNTSGGGIDVASHAGSLVAKTSGGSVSASFISPPTGDCLLKSSAGSIKLILPEHSGCWLDARTSAGSVNCDLALSGQTRIDRSHLTGKIGDGGPNVKLETSAGSIRISSAN